MRIGFFTSIEGWGGSETYLLSLMRGVADAGHEPVLYGVEGTRLFRDTQKSGIAVVAWKVTHRTAQEDAGQVGRSERQAAACLPSQAAVKRRVLSVLPHCVKLLAGNARETLLLRCLFARSRVDVMHVSNSGYEVASLACRLCHIPCLVMNMITPPDEPNWLRRRLMRLTLRVCDHVSSQSQACTLAWSQFAGLRSENCSYVWNGVDLSRFTPSRSRVRLVADPFCLLSVGRLHPMKGFGDLIEAVHLLEDTRLRLSILGEGPERATLADLIRRYRLEQSVELVGHTERPEDYLQIAHAFALVSVSHESCPAAVPEAMASGLPVITSDFGPLPEINLHGETGLVVPVRSPPALALAIRRLMDAPRNAAELGANGMRRAHKLFSRETMLTRTVSLYQSLARREDKGLRT